MDIKAKSSQLSSSGLANKKLKKGRTADLPDPNQIVDQIAISPDTILSQDPIVHIDPIAQALSSAIESSRGGGSSVGSTESYSASGDYGNSWSLAQNTPKEPSPSSSIASASGIEVSNSTLAMVLGGLALAGLAVGGGGGGSSSSSSSTSSGTSGAMADGYIANALVFRDVDNDAVWDHEVFVDNNNNGIYDTGDTYTDANGDGLFTAEAYVLTNASGVYTGLTGTGKIVATYLTDSSGNVLTTDVSTGLTFSSTYAAPDGSTIVNPLTSLIAAQLSSSTATAAEIAAAQTAVLTSLGVTLPTGSTLLTYDPLAVSSSSAASWATAVAVQKVAAQVANTIQVLASAATGVDTSMSNATAAMAALTALATTVSAGTTIDLSSSTAISAVGTTMTNTLVSNNTWSSANGASVAGQITAAASSLAAINTAINSISATSGTTTDVWANMASTQKVAQSTLATAIKESAQGGSAVDTSAFTGTNLTSLVASAKSDKTVPSAPTVTLTTDSGSSTTDKITNTGTLVLGGLETNAKVQYSINGGSNWQRTFTAAEGTNTVQVRQIDAAGNFSAATSVTFTYDSTAPSMPIINTATSDDVINSAERAAGVTITGTTQAGTTVTVNGNSATVTGTTWSYTFNAAAIDALTILNSTGSTELTIIATDLAGNTTTTKAWPKIDITAPSAPSITFVTDDTSPVTGTLSTSGSTNDTTPTIKVSLTNTGAVAGDTVQLYNGTAALGTATTLTSAHISAGFVDITTSTLSQATYNIHAKVVDAAGNTSSASTSFVTTVDTTAPSLAVNTVATDDLINSSERTTGVTISGTTEVGATVTVNGNLATLSGTSWSYLFNAVAINTFGQGTELLTIIATDAAGNTTTQQIWPIVDTVAPSAPTISYAKDNVSPVTTNVTSGGVTNDSTPTLYVSLANTAVVVGDTVNIFINGVTQGTVSLSATNISDGYVEITPSTALTDGTYQVTIQLTDLAGNSSALSNVFTGTVDTAAPTLVTRSFTVVENTTAVTTLVATNSESVTYSLAGTGADNALFSMTSGGVLTFLAAKNYEQPGSAAHTNAYALTVNVTDAAGNVRNQAVTVNVTNVSESMTGTVLDGYVAGATIFQDLNNNNVFDAGEPNTITNSIGQFILPAVVGSPNAPIKMISGFDIGTNEPIITTLGVPSTNPGVVVASPLSTIISMASANQPSTSLDALQSRLASYLGITEATITKVDLLTDNPLSLLTSSDSTEVSAAKTIFAANQYVMSLAHISGAMTKYIAEQFESQADTYLATLGLSSVDVLGSTDTYEKVGSDAIFKKVAADIAPSTVVSNDTFQLKSNYVTLTDYDPSTGSAVAYRAPITVASNIGTVGFEQGAINYTNLSNALNNTGDWQSPQISFDLQKMAASGSASLTMQLFDGLDASRTTGEREVGFTVSLSWTSDGSSATFTVPVQSISGYYYDRFANRYTINFQNLDSDLLTVTQAGPITPATLNLKLQSLLSKLTEVSPGNLLGVGDYHLMVSSTIPLAASDGANIDSFSVPISIKTSSAITVFAQDAQFAEAETVKEVGLYLNQASSSDVTVRYHFANGTATSGTDYTATSGTVTISSGSTSVFISVPVLTDTTAESTETVQLVIDSVTGATAMNTAATITIKDALASSTLYGNLSSTSAIAVNTQAETDLVTAIQAHLAQTTVTIGGQSRTLASVLSGHVDASTLISQYDALGQTILSATWSKLQTIFDSYSSLGATDYARSLMVANAGAKAFDLDQVVGDIFSSAGAYLANKSVTNLNTLIDNYVTLAGDTIGDIFGTDTGTYFSGASIVMLTRGNDTQALTNSSEIVAGLGGNDTVDMAGGNDKYIGGAGIDTVSGGAGNDWIYGYRGNDVLSGGDGNDIISAGAGDDLIDGGLGNDTLLGESGNDAISGGGGSDTINAGLGDDTISVGGNSGSAFTTVVDGGAGTDRLNINYSGITGLSDFTSRTYSNDVLTLTDVNLGTITASNIESLYVNNKAYVFYLSRDFSYDFTNLIWGSSEKTFYALAGSSPTFYPGGGNGSLSTLSGFNRNSDTLAYIGSTSDDYMNLNISRTNSDSGFGNYLTGSFNVSTGDGNDTVYGVRLIDTDRISLGSGNDSVTVYVSNVNTFHPATLDGGSGSDTLDFETSTITNGQTLTLTMGGALNFENLSGSASNEILQGDSNNNVIEGRGGVDTIYGYSGNDTLYAANINSSATGNDLLYGGDGDDLLIGSIGDNALDGGTGKDTLTGGGGQDTFVLRIGDGNTSISLADIITDFTDGTDVLGLSGNLTFSDLTITQGNGTDTSTSNVVIKASNEYLAIIQNTLRSNITISDFQGL